MLCFLFSSLAIANEPPLDVRSERAAFVSTFLQPGDIGLEIGVDLGKFSYHVLLPKAPAKLYLIDPWEYGLQADFETETTPEKQHEKERNYQNVCEWFAPFDNVQIIRRKAEEVAHLFPDAYFDYIYIDGEHSYAAVTRDLIHYFPKVKVGGWIIGDDYGWTGVAPAVQDFLKQHPDECFFLDDPYRGNTAGQFVIKKLR